VSSSRCVYPCNYSVCRHIQGYGLSFFSVTHTELISFRKNKIIKNDRVFVYYWAVFQTAPVLQSLDLWPFLGQPHTGTGGWFHPLAWRALSTCWGVSRDVYSTAGVASGSFQLQSQAVPTPGLQGPPQAAGTGNALLL
jgi:hypothetical protein